MNRERCGSDAGYWRHRRRHERPCLPCYDAHNEYKTRDRLRRPPREPLRYRAALAGREVAEALCTPDRHRLVADLHRLGWTDVDIAAHTRQTTYTTARIRAGLGLLPHRPGMKGVA